MTEIKWLKDSPEKKTLTFKRDPPPFPSSERSNRSYLSFIISKVVYIHNITYYRSVDLSINTAIYQLVSTDYCGMVNSFSTGMFAGFLFSDRINFVSKL